MKSLQRFDPDDHFLVVTREASAEARALLRMDLPEGDIRAGLVAALKATLPTDARPVEDGNTWCVLTYYVTIFDHSWAVLVSLTDKLAPDGQKEMAFVARMQPRGGPNFRAISASVAAERQRHIEIKCGIEGELASRPDFHRRKQLLHDKAFHEKEAARLKTTLRDLVVEENEQNTHKSNYAIGRDPAGMLGQSSNLIQALLDGQKWSEADQETWRAIQVEVASKRDGK